ncbi:hypothetical protein [Gemmatimonas sp.]|uniref:hypothetical protein n=1 Tax=Gemmatimonas sp. TaxID=1962908 RepID=UPI003DA6C75C
MNRPDRRSSNRGRPRDTSARGAAPRRATSTPEVGGEVAVVSRRGADRLRGGHPWVFRSDVERVPALPAGVGARGSRQWHAVGMGALEPQVGDFACAASKPTRMS